ncbi:hypothetical protein M9434_000428 [Picochlorum sp. BPE23]|nr:hypothetical protein M9434_000428 [Picochlorum sp. BPE23]
MGKSNTEEGDVAMTDANDHVEKTNKEEDSKVQTIQDKLLDNVRLIEEAVKEKEPRLISSRLLRQTQVLKGELTAEGIVLFVQTYLGGVGETSLERCQNVLKECGHGFSEVDYESKPEEMEQEEDGATQKKKKKKAEIAVIEAELYAYVVASMYLVQNKAWSDVLRVCQVGVGVLMEHNTRIVDPMGARLYSYMSLASEKMGTLSQIRGMLLQLYRAAVLRHDSIGQETLLNLLLRNYLHYKLYDQAEALRAKAQPETYKSSAQHCRLLYYHGRIQAVLLEYSDAKEALVQASRKAPLAAKGFRLQVAKWLIVVRLLLGEVPNRSEVAPADLRSMMHPYFELAKAVGAGDVNVFMEVASKYQSSFESDGLRHVVARLRANVIRSGVRRIATAYSRISLSDISNKLGLTNVSDAEYIVSKAIRDGGITAELDHETGIMTCSSVTDVYSTDEPLNAFHARIAFCLDVYNEAYKAIRHDPKARKTWNAWPKDVEEEDIEAILEDFEDYFDE